MRCATARSGKRVATYQITSEPRRLPPPNGLCNLETGPETFQLVTSSDAAGHAAEDLRRQGGLGQGRRDRLRQDAGQMSEAVVTKWSLVTKYGASVIVDAQRRRAVQLFRTIMDAASRRHATQR